MRRAHLEKPRVMMVDIPNFQTESPVASMSDLLRVAACVSVAYVELYNDSQRLDSPGSEFVAKLVLSAASGAGTDTLLF